MVGATEERPLRFGRNNDGSVKEERKMERDDGRGATEA